LERIFADLDLKQDNIYSVNISTNWHVEFLKREKKNLWNLQRWKLVEINFILI
jgi:hypothetical protein